MMPFAQQFLSSMMCISLIMKPDMLTAWMLTPDGSSLRLQRPYILSRSSSSFTQLYLAESRRDNDDQSSMSGGSTSVVTSQKRNQLRLFETIMEPMKTTVGDADSIDIESDKEILGLVQCIVMAADGRKADNVVALNVRRVSTMCNYLIILTGNSRPQNQAIASAICDDMKELYGMSTLGNGVPEGSAESGWILLDYGSIMVHIMTPKSRLYYNVEGQWKDKGGIYVDLSNMLIPNKIEQRNDDEDEEVSSGDDEIESDPFWS